MLELTGFFTITNDSAKSYNDAVVRLLLPERRVKALTAGEFPEPFSSNSFSFNKNSSSYSEPHVGSVHNPSHTYALKLPLSLPAGEQVEVPIGSAVIPFETVYWLDANFSPHSKNALLIEETDVGRKSTANLLKFFSSRTSASAICLRGKLICTL